MERVAKWLIPVWTVLLIPGGAGFRKANAAQADVPALRLEFSGRGAITAARWHGMERRITGATQLAGCADAGPAAVRRNGGAVEFERTLICGERRARVIDRFLAGPEAVRWEVEVHGEGRPWTAPIETHFRYPANGGVRFWTAWADPAPGDARWRDPLTTAPPSIRKLYYGAPPYRRDNPQIGFIPSRGDLFSLPLATFSEEDRDSGLSVVLAPDDTMLDLTLDTAADGSLVFSRLNHRIGGGTALRFHLDLVPHEAGWRGGLRYLVARYPDYFNPAIARADDLAGTGAYAGSEAVFDPAKMRAMGFRTNWMASFDFPYMGLFLPPVGDTETWVRFPGDSRGEYKPEERERNGRTSIRHMAEYARRMRELGFHVLNYFNVTEFGEHVPWPEPAGAPAASADWQDGARFLYTHFRAAILRESGGKPIFTWGGAVAMDPGEPAYQDHLLEQARRHLEKFPDADGLCIDRLDWLRLYNPAGDDGVSWFEDRPAQSLVRSWHRMMSRLEPEVHGAGKVLFCNNHTKRLDLLRRMDGIFDEFTYHAASLNTTAFLGVRRPVLGWTSGESDLRPDPDAYFQRHLHLGVYPMAPFPGNDHSLAPSVWVDRQYLEYGAMLDAMRGRKWVLKPHAVAVAGEQAKANLFETPQGYIVPVTFGGSAAKVDVEVRGIQAGMAEVLYPGRTAWEPVRIGRAASCRITVPLVRGCALLRLR